MIAAQCGAVLCENKDAKRRNWRLALLWLLYFLAFASLVTGVSLNGYLHVSIPVSDDAEKYGATTTAC